VIATLTSFARFILALALATRVVTVEAPQLHDDRAAAAIAYVAAFDEPLPGSGDPMFTEIEMLAGSFQESSWNADAVGKAGEIGLFQIWKGGPEMRDPVANARAGLAQMRVSFRDCPSSPWAEFLGGPHGIHNARVRRMSARREALAARFLMILSGAPDGAEVATVRP